MAQREFGCKDRLPTGGLWVFHSTRTNGMTGPKTRNGEAGGDSKPLIFAVDDKPVLIGLIAAILEPLGYRVRTFSNPSTALRAFKRSSPPPVLIITDFAMHHMTGLELIVECRRINPAQKIILVSGTVDDSIFRNAAAPPNRFLAKPYQTEELVKVVQEVLSE
jgi:CheY-like chemotaxis protein